MVINWVEIDGIGTLSLALSTVFAVLFPQIKNLLTKPKIELLTHYIEIDIKSPELIQQKQQGKSMYKNLPCLCIH